MVNNWRYVKPFSSDTGTLRTDRQTDRRTDLLYQYRASVCWRAIKMIRDSNPDFRINPVSDPDVCRIGPKMLWIHYLVCISQFAECRENRPMVVWEMLINLKSATLQRWRMWKSERKSVSRTGSPIIGRLMKSADCFCSNPAQRMTVRLNDTAISRIFKMADLRHLEF